MTTYQALTLCIALLAAIISAISLWRTWRTNQEQLALQRVMADLAKKQLEQIQNEEDSRANARLSFQIERSGRSARKFVVSNVGNAPAENVSFQLEPQGNLESPLVKSDYDEKFPVPVLAPGSSVAALAAIHFGTATGFRVVLQWVDTSGEKHTEETYASL